MAQGAKRRHRHKPMQTALMPEKTGLLSEAVPVDTKG